MAAGSLVIKTVLLAGRKKMEGDMCSPKAQCTNVSLAQASRKAGHLALSNTGKHSALGGYIVTLKKVRASPKNNACQIRNG